MKISKVSYSKLVSKPGEYSNIRFGAEADVLDGETPHDAATSLVYWVNRRLQELGYDEQVKSDLVGECERLEAQRKEISEVLLRMRDAAEKVNDVINDIPF